MRKTAGCFESEWRTLAPIVERALARRGVPKWLRDDVIQETALRLYRSWDQVDPDRGATGLALKIANNALWDEQNRRRVVELPGVLPERAAADDVEGAGLARLELRRVGSVLALLSPTHRSVLLAEVGQGSEPSSSSAATKMLRLRARRKMRSLLDAASAGAGLVLAPRAMWRALRSTRRDGVVIAAPTAVIAACGMVAFLTIPDVGPMRSPRIDTAAPASEALSPSRTTRSAPEARAPQQEGRTRDARPATSPEDPPPRPQGSYWQIGVGDEGSPVDGDAGIRLDPDPSGRPRLPECSTEQPAEGEVVVRCRASAGGQQVTAEASVRLGP